MDTYPDSPLTEPAPDTLIDLYRNMRLSREFAEAAARLFARGRVHGTAHFCIGEEAAGTGVCRALESNDLILQTHRGHNQAIGKGMDVNEMMAEFLGKATGCCRGKGGCMHIADFSRGSLGANGIVGGGLPLAAGSGLTQLYLGKPNITVCFFGDGAANEGSFHETLNLASIWRLPILFVCTNNQYGMSMPVTKSMHITDISVRASSYGIPGMTLDGNDVVTIYQETRRAREYILTHGPVLMVLETYRWMGHSKSDAQVYRTREEVAMWKARDPIARLGQTLLAKGIVSADEIARIDQEEAERIEAAIRFAENSPEPDAASLAEEVYAH